MDEFIVFFNASHRSQLRIYALQLNKTSKITQNFMYKNKIQTFTELITTELSKNHVSYLHTITSENDADNSRLNISLTSSRRENQIVNDYSKWRNGNAIRSDKKRFEKKIIEERNNFIKKTRGKGEKIGLAF